MIYRLLSSEQRSLEDSVALVLGPVVDVISSARTHVYMSQRVVHNAVEILVSVISQFLGGAALTRRDLWQGVCMCVCVCTLRLFIIKQELDVTVLSKKL